MLNPIQCRKNNVPCLLCRVALLLITTHTLPSDARCVVTSMVLQALLRPHLSNSTKSSAQLMGLLDCAVVALLLNLLHYLLLQAPQPPAPALIHHVDAILKVSLCCKHLTMSSESYQHKDHLHLVFFSSSAGFASVLGLSQAVFSISLCMHCKGLKALQCMMPGWLLLERQLMLTLLQLCSLSSHLHAHIYVHNGTVKLTLMNRHVLCIGTQFVHYGYTARHLFTLLLH